MNLRGNETKVVDGFSDFDWVSTVHVETENFSGEAIGMYEMPYQSVISALTAPHGPVQLMAMLDIFKLALVDQKKREDLDAMSFNGIAEILGQWTFKSTVDSTTPSESGGGLDRRLDPDKIVDMLADPTKSFEDVLDELNSQLADFEPYIKEENKRNTEKKEEPKLRRSFFGLWKRQKRQPKSD